MSFLFGLAAGFVVGWIVFKRPQWATDFFVWLKSKVAG